MPPAAAAAALALLVAPACVTAGLADVDGFAMGGNAGIGGGAGILEPPVRVLSSPMWSPTSYTLILFLNREIFLHALRHEF